MKLPRNLPGNEYDPNRPPPRIPHPPDADVVTGKLDVREAAAARPEVDPLAAENTPDDSLETNAV